MNNDRLKTTRDSSIPSIMVVEDEVLTADDIRAGLEEMGYFVISVVTSGEEAVERAEQYRPDIILMDIVLSGKIDGIEAANQIRERLNVPVIFLTSYADDDIIERAKITEPFGYVLKPFEQRELHIAIYMALYKARAEKELLKVSKLEATGIFAGGIAHDFNNLLFVILGNISMVQDQIKPGDSFFTPLARAEKAALQASDLIKKFVTFSTGGEPVKGIISVRDLVEQVAELALSGSNVLCEPEFDDPLLPVEADKDQIDRVLYNVIENARQAMPGGGIMEIAAQVIESGAENRERGLAIKDGQYVRILIKDHGIGIAQDELPNIFDPYYSKKERGSEKGMGLGLSVAWSVIRKHNGYIHAESEIGTGTSVYIYLPASEKPSPAEKKTDAAPVSAPGRTKRILLMDDEKMVREMCIQMLGRLGYEVETASHGQEAVEMYQKAVKTDRPFDAVILDLTIKGGMGGKEAIKRLIGIDPDVRAIVASGYSSDPIMSDFKNHGFIASVAKPYSMLEIKQLLGSTIGD